MCGSALGFGEEEDFTVLVKLHRGHLEDMTPVTFILLLALPCRTQRPDSGLLKQQVKCSDTMFLHVHMPRQEEVPGDLYRITGRTPKELEHYSKLHQYAQRDQCDNLQHAAIHTSSKQ